MKKTVTDYISENIGVLKYIPEGAFHRDGDKENVSRVSAFHMAQYEITRTQFLRIMGEDPRDMHYSGSENDPVQKVNWYMAIAFCNRLSIKEQLEPVYTVSGVDFSSLKFADIPVSDNDEWNSVKADWGANGYRLPTESEWQWAAMGASDSRTRPFAGSSKNNTIDDYAWYYKNSGDKYLTTAWNWNDIEQNKNRTHPVGVKKPNELDLYDMSGNVWEHCWDVYAQYPSGSVTDYRGGSSGSQRAYRGGGWHYNASYCAMSFRYMIKPDFQQYCVGLRVVRQ